MEAFYQTSSCFGVHFGIFIAHFGVRRGSKMILSHRAPSSLNMSSYRAIWTYFRSNSMIFEQMKIPKSTYLNFQILENRSLFVGRPFFRKLFASKNDAERYRRNILGPNFQKHLFFHFTDLWVLATRILVPRSWYQDICSR